MSWVRIDDHFPTHPKVISAGGDAAWLHICALCYCAEHSTDGHIPKPMVGRLSDRKGAAKLATRLVDVGLWVEHDDTYEIHDYLEFNPSREQVLSTRHNKSMAGAKGAASRWHGGKNAPLPLPLPQEKENGRRKRQPPKDFSPTEEHQTFAKASGLDLDREREDWLCWCEAHGKTYQSLNAGFSTWLRHAVEYGRGKTNSRRPRTDFDALQ